jgi:S1-C subfamily serine protease
MEWIMSILDELAAATARVAAAAGQAVVRIGRAEGRGTGVVIAAGTVLTSAHNLRGDEVTVSFPDGRSATGSVQGVDVDGDLAVVAVDTGAVGPIGWAAGPSESGTSDGPALGTPIFALALPAGASTARVTFGTVSAVGRSFRGPRGRLITDALEHTAPLGRGSSGGPLVDTEGRLVGINTHRTGDGLYLAVPATAALRSRTEALSRGESPTRRRLGIALAPPYVARRLRGAVGLPARDGVLVREISEGGPGAAAGLQRGDLIVSAGGQPVDSMDALLTAVDGIGDAGTLALGLVRGADELEVVVTFPAN